MGRESGRSIGASEGDRAVLVGLCHDIRQSVAAGLLLSSASNDVGSDELASKRMQMIHTQFRSIDMLLAAELGEDEPRWWLLDLDEIVQDLAEVVTVTHGVRVLRVADTDVGTQMYGDPVLVRRVLANVMDNAARAAGDQGQVIVRISHDGDDVVVEIEDDGAGFGSIPPGLGRGLTIVADALRAQRGHLEVSSERGAGTLVRLRLPSGVEGIDG